MKPVGEASRFLVRHAAALSVRLERCMAQEASATALRVDRAGLDLDRARAAEADRLVAAIADDPAGNRRRLLETREGVDRLIAAFAELRSNFDRPRWDDAKSARVDHLLGRPSLVWGISRERALGGAILGKLDMLCPEEGAGLDPHARANWAFLELHRRIEAEIRGLAALRATMTGEADARDRAGAPARALFDPSPEANLARRYEAAAGRAFHKALDRLDALKEAAAGPEPEPEPAPSPEAEPTDDPDETCDEVGWLCCQTYLVNRCSDSRSTRSHHGIFRRFSSFRSNARDAISSR